MATANQPAGKMDLVSYYKRRAKEYEKLYERPDRQADLNEAAQILMDAFSGKEVLEIACGTGYWTERIAQTATSIYATDINEEMIQLAAKRPYPPGKVSFGQENFYQFPAGKQYEALFGGFIWSHILLQQLDHFLGILNSLVLPGSTIALMDNHYVEGSNLPITYEDAQGNTYQSRQLEDGSSFQILKNFPSEDFLRQALAPWTNHLQLTYLEHYWLVRYTTRE